MRDQRSKNEAAILAECGASAAPEISPPPIPGPLMSVHLYLAAVPSSPQATVSAVTEPQDSPDLVPEDPDLLVQIRRYSRERVCSSDCVRTGIRSKSRRQRSSGADRERGVTRTGLRRVVWGVEPVTDETSTRSVNQDERRFLMTIMQQSWIRR
ncbi:MAG: hypothetical protein GY835_11650 [bacterium]|nr:hypothetical protein [bacterium]